MCTLESRIDRGEGWIDRSRLKFLENPINELALKMDDAQAVCLYSAVRAGRRAAHVVAVAASCCSDE